MQSRKSLAGWLARSGKPDRGGGGDTDTLAQTSFHGTGEVQGPLWLVELDASHRWLLGAGFDRG